MASRWWFGKTIGKTLIQGAVGRPIEPETRPVLDFIAAQELCVSSEVDAE